MEEQDDSNSCNMVGLLGILIQVGLGVLSFSVLFIKRMREQPRRPWKIWIFDTSKQLVSQLFAHFINLTISIALTYEDSSSDQCLWYFITNILDNTLGVLICVLALKAIESSLRHRGKLQYLSGNYYRKVTHQEGREAHPEQNEGEKKEIQLKEEGSSVSGAEDEKKTELVEQKDCGESESEVQRDTKASIDDNHREESQQSIHTRYHINYKAWLIQLLIWLSIVVVSKSIFFGFEFGLEDFLKNLSFSLMGWIERYPILELVLVIVVVPVVMNGLAFWVQDNFLMKKEEIPQGSSALVEESHPKKEGSN